MFRVQGLGFIDLSGLGLEESREWWRCMWRLITKTHLTISNLCQMHLHTIYLYCLVSFYRIICITLCMWSRCRNQIVQYLNLGSSVEVFATRHDCGSHIWFFFQQVQWMRHKMHYLTFFVFFRYVPFVKSYLHQRAHLKLDWGSVQGLKALMFIMC
jgi:hypothetical protein